MLDPSAVDIAISPPAAAPAHAELNDPAGVSGMVYFSSLFRPHEVHHQQNAPPSRRAPEDISDLNGPAFMSGKLPET